MENCTIYSHQINFDAVEEIVRRALHKANITLNDGDKQKQLTATIKGGFFKKDKVLKISYRERETPSYNLDVVNCGLTQNLSGMMNFLGSMPTSNPELKQKLGVKVMSCNTEMPFMAEPNITDEFKKVLLEITNKLDAIVFAQPNSIFNQSRSNHFTDKHLNLIIDQQGNSNVSDLEVNVDAKYRDQPAEEITQYQKARKSNSESVLNEKGVVINQNLPCVEDDSEVSIRSKKEISDRIHCLLVMAVRGEGLDLEKINQVIGGKKIDTLTAKEKDILSKEELDGNEKAYATWRYESLNTLLWAAGILPNHVYPSEICNVQEVVGAIMNKKRSEFDETIKVRSKKEILDALDLIYRMNWACVNARIKGEEPSGNLNGSVVYERHYALNWLTNHMGQEWDDVQTHT